MEYKLSFNVTVSEEGHIMQVEIASPTGYYEITGLPNEVKDAANRIFHAIVLA